MSSIINGVVNHAGNAYIAAVSVTAIFILTQEALALHGKWDRAAAQREIARGDGPW